LHGDSFTIDSQKVKGLFGQTPDRIFVWVPALKAVVDGVAVASDNIYPWVADNQTLISREYWRHQLRHIKRLKPHVVIRGHFLPGASLTLRSVNFTQKYLTTLDAERPRTKDAAALTTGMEKRYPKLKDKPSLEISAKVLKGEMKWPH